MKKVRFISLFVALLMIAVFASSCSGATKTTKYMWQEFSITMPNDFEQVQNDVSAFCISRKDSMMIVKKDSFDSIAAIGLTKDSDFSEYYLVIKEYNELGDSVLVPTVDDRYEYFTYFKLVDGVHTFYLAVLYKTENAFWLCQFACHADKYVDLMPKFLEWADTVQFTASVLD